MAFDCAEKQFGAVNEKMLKDLAKLFSGRPVWSAHALQERLRSPKGFIGSDVLCNVAYLFRSGASLHSDKQTPETNAAFGMNLAHRDSTGILNLPGSLEKRVPVFTGCKNNSAGCLQVLLHACGSGGVTTHEKSDRAANIS